MDAKDRTVRDGGDQITKGKRIMCYANRDANKTVVCQVGDLKAGDKYRTPEGRELMVLSLPADYDGFTRVTDAQGQVSIGVNSVRLGRDRDGRLYASRYLNAAPKTDEAADEAKNQADKAYPLTDLLDPRD